MLSFFSKIKQFKKTIKAYKLNVDFPYKLRAERSGRKNIIYLLHSSMHKAGGDKVIYKQSEIINSMGLGGFHSQILHPQKRNFKQTWFEHHAEIKQDSCFHPDEDFVIIPEIWATPHGNMLHKLGIKYGIFVQNGYSINIPLYSFERQALNDAYENASVILSISDDTTECIKLAFPKLLTEIIRIFYSVDAARFKASLNKENLITYMPRKLARHSKLLMFYLKEILPKGWVVKPIDGLNEEGVQSLLSRSKLFLSFSEFEGCPLPPVEAALSGNHVVGYTGEGAREYWHPAIFTEVACGNMRDYAQKIIAKLQMLETNDSINADAIAYIADRYSPKNEKKSLEAFVNKVNQVF